MSKIKSQLLEDIKTSMKSGEREKLTVLRTLLSDLKNVEIDAGEQDDAGVLAVIKRTVKQIKEALEAYQLGGRQDLVAEESLKLKVLEAYLPAQLSNADLEAKVLEAIKAAGEALHQGKLIGQLSKQLGAQADGSRIAAMVMKLLK